LKEEGHEMKKEKIKLTALIITIFLCSFAISNTIKASEYFQNTSNQPTESSNLKLEKPAIGTQLKLCINPFNIERCIKFAEL
jgi:hypothetical protein